MNEILERVESGMTTTKDADLLRGIFLGHAILAVLVALVLVLSKKALNPYI